LCSLSIISFRCPWTESRLFYLVPLHMKTASTDVSIKLYRTKNNSIRTLALANYTPTSRNVRIVFLESFGRTHMLYDTKKYYGSGYKPSRGRASKKKWIHTQNKFPQDESRRAQVYLKQQSTGNARHPASTHPLFLNPQPPA
jgi:hypothetical protein